MLTRKSSFFIFSLVEIAMANALLPNMVEVVQW